MDRNIVCGRVWVAIHVEGNAGGIGLQARRRSDDLIAEGNWPQAETGEVEFVWVEAVGHDHLLRRRGGIGLVLKHDLVWHRILAGDVARSSHPGEADFVVRVLRSNCGDGQRIGVVCGAVRDPVGACGDSKVEHRGLKHGHVEKDVTFRAGRHADRGIVCDGLSGRAARSHACINRERSGDGSNGCLRWVWQTGDAELRGRRGCTEVFIIQSKSIDHIGRDQRRPEQSNGNVGLGAWRPLDCETSRKGSANVLGLIQYLDVPIARAGTVRKEKGGGENIAGIQWVQRRGREGAQDPPTRRIGESDLWANQRKVHSIIREINGNAPAVLRRIYAADLAGRGNWTSRNGGNL